MMSMMNQTSTAKLSQNHSWKSVHCARFTFSSPVPHIDSTMSVSNAISMGTTTLQ